MPSPIAIALATLRGWASATFGVVVSFFERLGWKGGCIVLTLLCAFLTIQLFTQPAKIQERIVTKVERQIEKATAKEVVRVERQMVPVRVQSAKVAAELDAAKVKIANLQEYIRNASSIYDSSPCLGRDRLQQLSDLSEVLRDPGH